MFILIEVADREINAEKFDTLSAAQHTMKQYYNKAGHCENGEIYEFEAWKNYAGFNHVCYDWKIIEL